MTQSERNQVRKAVTVAVAPTFAAMVAANPSRGHQNIVHSLVSFAETIVVELMEYEKRDNQFYEDESRG
jgi:hypothetical protein